MKFKTLLTKSLLVVAGLCAGVSGVWGEDTYTQKYARAMVADDANSISAWSDTDKTDWGGATNLTVDNTTAGFGFNVNLYSTSTGITASKSFATTLAATDSKVKYEFSWYFGSSLSNAANYAYVSFGNFIIRWYNNGYSTSLSTDGGSNFTTFAAGCTSNSTWTKDVVLIVNLAKKTIESFTFGGTDFTSSVSGAIGGSLTDVGFGFVRGSRGGNWPVPSCLKSFKVSECEQEVTLVNYTVKFQDTEGNTLKDDAVYSNGVVGAVYTASSSDMATFYSDDSNKKYVYKSGQNTEIIASSTAASNVITLVFDTYTKYHYALTTSAGSQVNVQEGDEYSDKTKTLYYPVCIKDGSDYYVVAKNGSAPYFGYTLSSGETTKTITYTLDNTIVYYAEAEDIASKLFNGDWLSGNSSNGVSKILSADKNGISYLKTDMNTTSDGVYNITIASGDRSNRAYDRTWYLVDNEDNKTILKNYNITNNQFLTDEITTIIPASSEIYYSLDNSTGGSAINDNYAIDYILVRKLYDVTDASKIVGAVDYTSAYRSTFGSDIVIPNGSAKKVTFKNHGSGTGTEYYKNWVLDINYDGSLVTTVRSDWYAFDKGTFTYGYTYSSDGGATADNTNIWGTWLADNTESDVELTLSHVDGKLYVIGTITKDSKVYYVNYTYGDGSQAEDFTLNLSVDHSWIEVLSVADAATLTTPVHPTSVSTTIGSTGYSTFASIYPLDLSAISGATAYYAKTVDTENSKVVFESTEASVPAGEGLLLKGTASAPVTINIADAGTAIDGNLLVGCTAETPLTQNANQYVLAIESGKAVFQSLADQGATIPAGKAYLNAMRAGARQLSIVFEDASETTGIGASLTKNEEVKNGTYNLQGQRIAQPRKGLYIVGGKKVVVK